MYNNSTREKVYQAGLMQLPQLSFPKIIGKNGEELATDEAAVWKRVLNYRIAKYLNPGSILETHPGKGISSFIYVTTCPNVRLYNQNTDNIFSKTIDLIDIDPFGQPWDCIEKYLGNLEPHKGVLMITNGEAYSVRRNLKRAQKYPTNYYGKMLPHWVIKEYLPKLSKLTKMDVKFFYAYPTSVRAILSNCQLPSSLWKGCPNWMWWLNKYVEGL